MPFPPVPPSLLRHLHGLLGRVVSPSLESVRHPPPPHDRSVPSHGRQQGLVRVPVAVPDHAPVEPEDRGLLAGDDVPNEQGPALAATEDVPLPRCLKGRPPASNQCLQNPARHGTHVGEGRRGRGRGKMRSHGCWSAKMEGGTRRVERGSSRDLPVACEGGERPIVGMDDFFGYSWIRLPPVIPVEPRRPSFLHVRGRGPHATNVP